MEDNEQDEENLNTSTTTTRSLRDCKVGRRNWGVLIAGVLTIFCLFSVGVLWGYIFYFYDNATYSDDPSIHAANILNNSPLIDGHNDLPWEFRRLANDKVVGGGIDFASNCSEILMTDLPRLRAGGMGCQIWSVYVPCSSSFPVQMTMEQIDFVHNLVDAYPEDLALVTTADELETAFRQGKIGSMIGMEGGHSINSSLAVLRSMYEFGARYMTLTHSCNTPWADCAQGPFVNQGLSDFGKNVVLEMNRIGMIVDISHVSDDTMRMAIETSRAPIMFSHSCTRYLCNHVRNVPDDVLKMLPQKDGVLMINFFPTFVKEEARLENIRLSSQPNATDETVEIGMIAFQQSNPERSTLLDVVDHIDHVRKTIGSQYVGLGSDFDGIPYTTDGLRDVSTYPAIVTELLRRDYSESEVKGIIGGNFIRVFKKVEAIKKEMAHLPPFGY